MFLEWWMIALFVVVSAFFHVRSFTTGYKKGYMRAIDTMQYLMEKDPAELAKLITQVAAKKQ